MGDTRDSGFDDVLERLRCKREQLRSESEQRISTPSVDPRAGREIALGLYRRLREGRCHTWQLVEAFAFEMTLHIPSGIREGGLLWPEMIRDPEQEDVDVVLAFSNRASAQSAAEAGNVGDSHPLDGVEALRWIWAMPSAVEMIYVDWPERDGWMRLPVSELLGAFFPIAYSARFDDIPRVPLAALARLPGYRVFKPEVMRSLLENWRDLWSLETADGEQVEALEIDGRKLLPIFSCREELDRYVALKDARSARPVSGVDVLEEHPPYEGWLQASLDCDGVVLDPLRERPLGMRHFELLALALRSEHPRVALKPPAVLAAMAGLLRRGKVGEARIGEIAADWPRYFVISQSLPGGRTAVLKTGGGAMVAFSDEERARAYIAAVRDDPRLRGTELRPRPFLSRWRDSIFDRAASDFDGVWIDPNGSESDEVGLRLGRPGIEAARRYLSDALHPRVPGFD